MLFVFGPLHNVDGTPPSIPGLVFFELLGIWAIYAGIFSEQRPRGMFTKASRIAVGALFVAVGTFFVLGCVSELHHRRGTFKPLSKHESEQSPR
jgi:hypothetical protein